MDILDKIFSHLKVNGFIFNLLKCDLVIKETGSAIGWHQLVASLWSNPFPPLLNKNYPEFSKKGLVLLIQLTHIVQMAQMGKLTKITIFQVFIESFGWTL